MNEKFFNKGEVVFREGEIGKSFFQITKGTAGVYVRYGEADQRKLTDMKEGQFFGEMAVADAWSRSTTIIAEEPLYVLEIDGGMLDTYFREQPDKILALMKQLGRRIRELTAEYDEVCAFIREKQEAGAEKKEGFLARLKKQGSEKYQSFDTLFDFILIGRHIHTENAHSAAVGMNEVEY